MEGLNPYTQFFYVRIDPHLSARELFHWSLYLNLFPEGSILMLKKQDLGINPHVPKNGSRDQSLTGIGGPRVYVAIFARFIASQTWEHFFWDTL